jgi:hypothetical protein
MFPGCKNPKFQGKDLCKFPHGAQPQAGRHTIPNDGLIDPIAIEIAVRGTREVRLTWPERYIAAAMMHRLGVSFAEINMRLHWRMSEKTTRKIREVADAIGRPGGPERQGSPASGDVPA